MSSIPVRWVVRARFILAFLLLLGASSCCKETPNMFPHTLKKLKPVPCDTIVTVYPDKEPEPESVYLCEDDKLKWVKATGTDSFDIKFEKKSPFADGAIHFKEDDSEHKGKKLYGPLEVDKYTIIVNSTQKFDPQVVAGGNP